jgi:hypothetical protein
VRAVKIRRDQRLLLLAGETQVTCLRMLRVLYLTRWAAGGPKAAS